MSRPYFPVEAVFCAVTIHLMVLYLDQTVGSVSVAILRAWLLLLVGLVL